MTSSTTSIIPSEGRGSAVHTPGPWGIEQTRDMLWVGPMRPDGHKVDQVVVGLNIDGNLTPAAALRQYRNARLIAAAPELLEALEGLVKVAKRKIYPQPDKPDSAWAKLQAAQAAIFKARGVRGQ